MKLLPQDEEDVIDELRNTEEYCELLRMKHIKRLKEQEAVSGVARHYGYSVSSHFSSVLLVMVMHD